ncbi:hypothetical protein Tco_0214934 [Tanacetum coccineum]
MAMILGRKSTSGGIQFLGDKLVSWMSKKQNCTAMSSEYGEYERVRGLSTASCAQIEVSLMKNEKKCMDKGGLRSKKATSTHLRRRVNTSAVRFTSLIAELKTTIWTSDAIKPFPATSGFFSTDNLSHLSRRYTRYLLTSHSEIVDIE